MPQGRVLATLVSLVYCSAVSSGAQLTEFRDLTAAAGLNVVTYSGSVERPLPQRILVDNGTEFTSKALDAWAYWNKVKLDFSRRGRPGDNAHIEAFNSLVRRECLSQHWFTTLEEACGLLEDWKEEYNNDRPHGSLQQMPPARYRAGGITAEDRDEPETRTSGGSEKG